MGHRLYGVVLVPQRGVRASRVRDTTLITFRELGAVVRESPYARVEPSEQELGDYRAVVDAIFQRGTILPAPFGTVFRSGTLVERWLEMNHISLAEGLEFVEGRCEARVHISEGDSAAEQRGADTKAAATECFDTLRRHAAAAVPLRQGADGKAVLSSAFLVVREQWEEFSEQVQELARRSTALDFDQTGPWPPFDFVRMDFGA